MTFVIWEGRPTSGSLSDTVIAPFVPVLRLRLLLCAACCGVLGCASDGTGAGPASSNGDTDGNTTGDMGGDSGGNTGVGSSEGGDAGSPDSGGVTHDGGGGSTAASRCTIGPTNDDIDCQHQTGTIGGRSVTWETPLGTPPPGGWPVVLIYQGSLLSPDGKTILAPHGMWQVADGDGNSLGPLFADYVMQQLTTETLVIKNLLDGGYAVVAPTADGGGFAWDTNFPPWTTDWAPSPDAQFLTVLFADMNAGKLGPLSASRWYAAGVSSGGFMTSRMAVSYEGTFRALAIDAGSYATCAGGSPCAVPALPADHPPTLFLEGGEDPLVPPSEVTPYHDKLAAMGCDTKYVLEPYLKHGWALQSPDAIVAWFESHP